MRVRIAAPGKETAGSLARTLFFPRSRRRRAARRLLLFAVVALSTAAFARAEKKDKSDALAKLQFRDLAGRTQRLADYRGKILVLNFWATWCKPCRAELPMLNHLAGDYAEKGVVFLAVSLDEKRDWSKVPAFLAENRITLTVLVGANAGTVSRLRLGDEVPATIIFDTQGQPVARFLGEARRPELAAWLDWLLGPQTTPRPAPIIRHL